MPAHEVEVGMTVKVGYSGPLKPAESGAVIAAVEETIGAMEVYAGAARLHYTVMGVQHDGHLFTMREG